MRLIPVLILTFLPGLSSKGFSFDLEQNIQKVLERYQMKDHPEIPGLRQQLGLCIWYAIDNASSEEPPSYYASIERLCFRQFEYGVADLAYNRSHK